MIEKKFTVVFDVVASGIVQGNPAWAAGTGQVNFSDTLKPSAIFFTGDNGNPVPGIGVVGALSSLPAAGATLTLSPAAGNAVMENQYTVTAHVSDSTNVPVAGAPEKFIVTSGPDASVAGNGFSDNNGNSQFTFTGQGGAGTDTIQASTGPLTSNTVQVTWQSAKCPAAKDSGKTI
jgi:hypothetical protein